MMSGGPVLYYLEKLAGLEKTQLVVTGYQATGTNGYELTHDHLNLFLNEKEIKVQAEIIQLKGLSSHADQRELIQFVKELSPSKVYLVHGENDAKNELLDKLNSENFMTEIPLPFKSK